MPPEFLTKAEYVRLLDERDEASKGRRKSDGVPLSPEEADLIAEAVIAKLTLRWNIGVGKGVTSYFGVILLMCLSALGVWLYLRK